MRYNLRINPFGPRILFVDRTSQFQETTVRGSAGGEDDGEVGALPKHVNPRKGSLQQLLEALSRTIPHQALGGDTTLSDYNTRASVT